MSDPIRQFIVEIERNIVLSKRLTLELHKVAGKTEVEVEEYAKAQLRDNFGLLFFNFVNFPMVKPYPFLWKLQTSHNIEEEQSYIDKNAVAKYIAEKLEIYLSERMIDEVKVLLLEAEESVMVGRFAQSFESTEIYGSAAGRIETPTGHPEIELVSTPAAVRASSFDLPTGQTIIVSTPAEPISEQTAAGYADVKYQITSNIGGAGHTLPLYFTILHPGSKVTGNVSSNDLVAGFKTFIAKNFMPNSKLVSVYRRDDDGFYLDAVIPDEAVAEEPVYDPDRFDTEMTTLTVTQLKLYCHERLTALQTVPFEDSRCDTNLPFERPYPVSHKGREGIAKVGHGGYIVAYGVADSGVAVDYSPSVMKGSVRDFIERIRSRSH